MSETTRFESVLKSADLVYGGAAWIFWTLKFENGAILRVKDPHPHKSGAIWWVGKKYRVEEATGKIESTFWAQEVGEI